MSKCGLNRKRKRPTALFVTNATDVRLTSERDRRAYENALCSVHIKRKTDRHIVVYPTVETVKLWSILNRHGSEGKFLLNSFIGSNSILSQILYVHLVNQMLYEIEIADIMPAGNGKQPGDRSVVSRTDFILSNLKMLIQQLATNAVETFLDESNLSETFIAACKYSLLFNIVPRKPRQCIGQRYSNTNNSSSSLTHRVSAIAESFKKNLLLFDVIDYRRLVLFYNTEQHTFLGVDLNDHTEDANSNGSSPVIIDRGMWRWADPCLDAMSFSFNAPVQLILDEEKRYALQRLMRDRADVANSLSCKVIVDHRDKTHDAKVDKKQKKEIDDEIIEALQSIKKATSLKTRKFNDNLKTLIQNGHDRTELLNAVAHFDPTGDAVDELQEKRRCLLYGTDVRQTDAGHDKQMDVILNRPRTRPRDDQRLPMNPAFLSSDAALDKNAHLEHMKGNLLSAADMLRNALTSMERTLVENQEFKKRIETTEIALKENLKGKANLETDNKILRKLLAKWLVDSSAKWSDESAPDQCSKDDTEEEATKRDYARLQAEAGQHGVIRLSENERFCNATLKADAPSDERTGDKISNLYEKLTTHLFGLRWTHDATGNVVDWYVNRDTDASVRAFVRKYTTLHDICVSTGTSEHDLFTFEKLFAQSPIGTYIKSYFMQTI